MLKPTQSHFTAQQVRFESGAVLPKLRMAYTTLGQPSSPAVLLLHGSNGSGADFLNPAFAGELFGAGQPLDAAQHFIIMPDALGAGQSSKPSDGLRMQFPAYSTTDMVAAQHRLITQHLGIARLKLVLGHSMGGMHTWLWAQQFPAMMALVVPLACLPIAMGGRNWMLRRLLVEAIQGDAAWLGGDYTAQPPSFKLASLLFNTATNGGTAALMHAAPTAQLADAWVDARLNAPATGDANDHIYQWLASRSYDPSPHLERIQAQVLAINAADDERNPLELGVLSAALQRVRRASEFIIPASAHTAGHATTLQAALWKGALIQALAGI